MTQFPIGARNADATGAEERRQDAAADLPGGFLSEGTLPLAEHAVEPDGLSCFPSEGPSLTGAARGISPVVQPTTADRERFAERRRTRRIPLRRLTRAMNPVLGLLAVALIIASIIRDQSMSSVRDLEVAEPLAMPGAPPADIAARPADEAASLPALSAMAGPPPVPTREPNVPREGDTVKQKPPKIANRAHPPAPTPTPIKTASVPNWALVSALARPTSSSAIGPIGTSSAAPDVTPPFSAPPAASAPTLVVSPTTAMSTPTGSRTPIAAAPPAASPAPSASDASSGTTRTALVRSVIDRYREAFDTLDASAVEGFWPSVDQRALGRAFAQLESQRLQFDRCDIQLAGSRAFASCHGYAQLVRKAGSQDPRLEPRQWTFTLGEVKDRWVILGVDARQAR